MSTVTSNKYIVRPGDNLSKIARLHNLSSWKALYDAPDNEAFRKKRPKPNYIQPGDVLMIPPNALELLKVRLKHLLKAKEEAIRSFKEIEDEIDREYRKVKNFGQNIEMASTVATIVVNLGSLVKQGMKNMGLQGEALAKANAELVKTHVKNTTETVVSIAVPGQEPTGEEGMVWALTKILYKSWQDMNSPTYWASRLVGATPEETYMETKTQLKRMSTSVLVRLNDKIRITREQIEALERERFLILP